MFLLIFGLIGVSGIVPPPLLTPPSSLFIVKLCITDCCWFCCCDGDVAGVNIPKFIKLGNVILTVAFPPGDDDTVDNEDVDDEVVVEEEFSSNIVDKNCSLLSWSKIFSSSGNWFIINLQKSLPECVLTRVGLVLIVIKL